MGGALKGGKPYAMIGFSFGAVLAYEVGKALSSGGGSEGPALVAAVSSEGPSWEGRKGAQHKLDMRCGTDRIRTRPLGVRRPQF